MDSFLLMCVFNLSFNSSTLRFNDSLSNETAPFLTDRFQLTFVFFSFAGGVVCRSTANNHNSRVSVNNLLF